MDDGAAAFGPLADRVAAEAGRNDRIALRDHVRAIEIGAFPSERGVTQRVAFSVVLDVAPAGPPDRDDVDHVVSYDMILRGIDACLADTRLNLLETLAERLAAWCLDHPRIHRAWIRIEKLDRVPGALGVEIVRVRPTAGPVPLRPIAPPPAAPPRPRPAILLAGAPGGDVAALVGALGDRRAVLIPAPWPVAPAPAAVARRVALLALDQGAEVLAAADPRLVVVRRLAELDWALEQGLVPVWAPASLIGDALAPPERTDPAALAGWLAPRIGAGPVVAVWAAAPGLRQPGPAAIDRLADILDQSA